MRELRDFDRTRTLSNLTIGGIYVIFSGNDDTPYTFAKLLARVGAMLILKMWRDEFATEPQEFCESTLKGRQLTMPIPFSQFAAWGPPGPVLYAIQLVTQAELEQCDWT